MFFLDIPAVVALSSGFWCSFSLALLVVFSFTNEDPFDGCCRCGRVWQWLLSGSVCFPWFGSKTMMLYVEVFVLCADISRGMLS